MCLFFTIGYDTHHYLFLFCLLFGYLLMFTSCVQTSISLLSFSPIMVIFLLYPECNHNSITRTSFLQPTDFSICLHTSRFCKLFFLNRVSCCLKTLEVNFRGGLVPRFHIIDEAIFHPSTSELCTPSTFFFSVLRDIKY